MARRGGGQAAVPKSNNVFKINTNLYDPNDPRYARGNTVTNYLAGVQSPKFTTSPKDNKNYIGSLPSTNQFGPTNPGTNTLVDGTNAQSQTTGGVTQAGTQTQTQQPNLVEYPTGSGFYYNLNDDTERQSFYNRRLSDLTQNRDTQLNSIDQEIADLTGQSKDYVKNYFKQLEDFTNTKSAGDINRADAYQSASPNAFQSSEYDSANLANQNYLKGVGETAAQAQDVVGADYLANPNDPNLLGGNTVYGRALAKDQSARNDVGSQYNDYLAGITQQNNPDTNPFAFNYQQAGQQTPSAVDISAYKPFVDFKQVSGQFNPGSNSYVPRVQNTFTNQTPIDNFLGRTQVSSQDKDFLRNYLLGG